MSLLVDPFWLSNHLYDPAAVVLDATLPPVGITPPVDTRARYLASHIPGAVFFDIEEFSDHSTHLPHMLPSEAEFSRKIAELGVGNDMRIVIYEQEGVFSAPRAWWMLRVFGARDVHILDGGLHSWTEAGFPTECGEVHRPAASFPATLNPNAVKSFSEIQAMLQQDAQIVDARSAGRFAGTAPEPRPGLSSGHMPASISLPFTELVQDGRMKSSEQLHEIFREKEIDLERPVTTTCGSGVTAAVIALGLELVGAKDISLYDGSWAEYAQRPEAVIEKSE